MHVHSAFPRYAAFSPAVPVWCATPHEGRAIHRFFDTNPLSPSGRYLAVLRLPFEDRLPRPGETARVCVIDLQTGDDRTVAETTGWEPQLGANINWGADDESLFFNDVDPQTWRPFAWRCNPLTGQRTRLDGTVYHASPDGRWLASSDMTTMRRTQHGYGVVVPDEHVARNVGVRDDTGLWITDATTGQRTLVATLRQFVDAGGAAMELPDDESTIELYGFHTKWNAAGNRLIYTLRWFRNAGEARRDELRTTRFAVFTLKPDGSDIRLAVPPRQWDKGGHHINFFPNGRQLSMNLNIERCGMRLVQCGLDGTELSTMHPTLLGSGHPTVHPDSRHVLTDVYATESLAFGDGTVPLRWIDLETGTERCLVRFSTAQPSKISTLRVDPHPAWDRPWRYVTFNAYEGGARRVFVADLKEVTERR